MYDMYGVTKEELLEYYDALAKTRELTVSHVSLVDKIYSKINCVGDFYQELDDIDNNKEKTFVLCH